MSDDMQREKRELLTTKQIEEIEEMKKKLTGIGIYEPGSTYKEMKELLGFLSQSGNTPNDSDNKGTLQENVQHSELSEMTTETEVPEVQAIAQERVELPRPSYSYKTSCTSPTTYERNTIRYSTSPESSPIFEARNSVYRRKSPDADEMLEKQPEDGNRFVSLRNSNVTRECQSAATENAKAATARSEHNQKLDKRRMNPFDVSVNENDVPLQQPSRLAIQERMPFGRCKEAHTCEQRQQVAQAISQHLKDIAELWYSWHRPADSKFQWGSPIQVGTANGSLDRKPLTEPKTEPIKVECTYRDSYERASKRKASSLLAKLNRKSSSEEDDEYEFTRAKKKKIQSDRKSGNVDHTKSQRAQASKYENEYMGNICFDENIDDQTLYFEKRINEENGSWSPELTRRITPTTPKGRLSLARHRKRGNIASKPRRKMQHIDKADDKQSTEDRKKSGMTKEQIRQTLEEEDDQVEEEEEEEEVTIVKKDVEIRPITRESSRARSQEKQTSSNTTETKETRTKSKEREIECQRKKERKTEHGERYGKEEIYKVENSDRWEDQLMSLESDEWTIESNRESDVQNGNQCDNIPTSNNIQCPICNKLFPPNEIEDHAASCYQFETNNEEDDNGTDDYVCSICNNYKTADGIQYGKHVQQCIKLRTDKMLLLYTEPQDVVTDEQKDHEDHSSSPSRTKLIMNRKRKH